VAAFLKRPRAAQSVVLSLGTLLFWSAPFGYTGVITFSAFVIFLALGNVVFAGGLMYDALVISETESDAAAAPPALAQVLLARLVWRWRAFWVLVFATLLCVPATLLYVQAARAGATAGQQPDLSGDRAARLIWCGDAYFAVSTILFCVAFAFQAVDASLTMHDLAKLTGQPPPGFDEAHKILALIGGGLIGLALGLTLQVMGRPSLALEAIVGLFSMVALVALTWGSLWLLQTQVREFKEQEREDRAACEETGLLQTDQKTSAKYSG
jgi:hypothetical protein